MAEQFLRAGATYGDLRWLMQELCRQNGEASKECGVVAQRTEFQGPLTPIELDATMVWRLLLIANSEDSVASALAARDIAMILQVYAHAVVHFLGLFSSDRAEQILTMPAKAAIAKRKALLEWERTGKMPVLVAKWAERDPTILDEYGSAGAPVVQEWAASPTGVSAGRPSSATMLLLAAAALALLAASRLLR